MIAEILFTMALAATDQTINVTRGTKLDVNNFAGDVIVKVWDKDAVHVEVAHSDREVVDIKPGDQTLSVRSRSVRGGPPRSLDYTITVPVWMPIAVSGTYADVTIEGTGGDVNVDTTRGDITVRGGSGFVSLKSVQGLITVERAKGRLEVRGVNESIRLADITGDVSAETTNGNIILDRVDSPNVDLYTVNGTISYDGPIRDKGVYRLTTHNGSITMPVPEKANAAMTMRTYNGSIRASFPLPSTDPERRNRRVAMTLGNGSAHVELESFGGSILLRRPGEPRPETDRRKQKDKDQVRLGTGRGLGAGAGAGIGASIADAVDQAVVDIDVDAIVDAALASVPSIDVIIDAAMAGVPHPVVVPHPVPVPTPRIKIR